MFFPLLTAQAFRSDTLPREIGFIPASSAAVRAGTAFFDSELLDPLLGAQATFSPRTGVIAVSNGARRLLLRVGSTRMVVDGKTTVMVPAPYRQGAFAMVAFRPIANALGRTYAYEVATNSLLIPRPGKRRLHCVPLPTDRTGVVITSVDRGVGQGPEIRIQIQASAPKGNLVVQLRDEKGKPFMESVADAPSGGFREVLVLIGKRDESGDRNPTTIAAFIRRPDGTTTRPVVAKSPLRDNP